MVALGADQFEAAAGLPRRWLKRPLRELRRRTAFLRCAVAAPISPERRTRLAWLAEEHRWRAASIPVMDVVRALYRVEETGTFYVPIQKAGCTSMTMALRQGAVVGFNTTAPVGHGQWRNPLHLGCVPEDFRSGACVAFTVVRHPISRFWSAYNHLVVLGADDRIGAVVRQSLALDPNRQLTPDLVLEYVRLQPTDDLYFAFRPQFAICGLEMLPMRIVRLENLMDDLAPLVDEGLLPTDFLGRVGKLNVRNSDEVHERYRRLDPRVEEVYGHDMAILRYS